MARDSTSMPAARPAGFPEMTLSECEREQLVEHLCVDFTSRGLRDDYEPTPHGVLVDELIYLFSFDAAAS